MAITRKIDIRKVTKFYSSLNLKLLTISGKVSIEIAGYGQSGGMLVKDAEVGDAIKILEETIETLKKMNQERADHIMKIIKRPGAED